MTTPTPIPREAYDVDGDVFPPPGRTYPADVREPATESDRTTSPATVDHARATTGHDRGRAITREAVIEAVETVIRSHPAPWTGAAAMLGTPVRTVAREIADRLAAPAETEARDEDGAEAAGLIEIMARRLDMGPRNTRLLLIAANRLRKINDTSEVATEQWQPGDPIYPFEPDYAGCSACSTTWGIHGNGPWTCPECGAPALAASPPAPENEAGSAFLRQSVEKEAAAKVAAIRTADYWRMVAESHGITAAAHDPERSPVTLPVDTNRHGLPVYVGEDWTVQAAPDGEVEVSVADDAHPGSSVRYAFEADIVAAIAAAGRSARSPSPAPAAPAQAEGTEHLHRLTCVREACADDCPKRHTRDQHGRLPDDPQAGTPFPDPHGSIGVDRGSCMSVARCRCGAFELIPVGQDVDHRARTWWDQHRAASGGDA